MKIVTDNYDFSLQSQIIIKNQFNFFLQEITRDVESVEALVAQVNSLQHKLGGNVDSKEFTSFLIQLMRGKEVSVLGGARGDIGARITTMFRDAQKVKIRNQFFKFKFFLPSSYTHVLQFIIKYLDPVTVI